jgi:deoxyadenosine/deoxycytidine kinase
MSKRSESIFAINTLEELDSQIIAIQGSIGAGKSTLLERVRHYLTKHNLNVMDPNHAKDGRSLYLVVEEPIGEWEKKIFAFDELPEDDRIALSKLKNDRAKSSSTEEEEEEGEGESDNERDAMSTSSAADAEENSPVMVSHFDLVNVNPTRYGTSFQLSANTTRLASYLRAFNNMPELPENTRIYMISERSMLTDYLFAENLYEMGFMNTPEWYAYKKNYAINTKSLLSRENLMIYVGTDVDTCMKRIAERGRPSEKAIPREYMLNLHKKHVALVDQFKGHVIRLDELEKHQTIEEMDAIVEGLMPRIEVYMNNCYT